MSQHAGEQHLRKSLPWRQSYSRCLNTGALSELGKHCCSSVGMALISAYSNRAQQRIEQSCLDAGRND